jgi:hypothetical protein
MAFIGALAWGAGCIDLPGAKPAEDGDPIPVTPPAGDAGGGSHDAGPLADARSSVSDGANADDAEPVDAGGADVVTAPPWKLYSNAEGSANPNAWNVVALDVAWSGPNAPPPRGIMAAAQLDDFPRLLVWADDGKFYVRDEGGWRAPVATATAFPALAGRDFRGCYHHPTNPGTAPASRVETLTFVDNPTAILYRYTALDAVQFISTVTMIDEPAPYGAPKGSKKARWVISHWNPAKYMTAAYLAEYSGYDGDPYVYFFDATPATTNKWLFANAPLFAGKTNPPPQADIMAGFRDDALAINYLIVR